MAVYVNIADTQHRAFSPLNVKHNILYQRARQNVNHRYINKPSFDPQPFWKGQARTSKYYLDHFSPEEDGPVDPLESLVLLEDYTHDNPEFVKEFKLDEFWDYIFSDSWKENYSVRVLEGRLLDALLVTLNSFTTNGIYTQHSTMAYAKNTRPQPNCYKQSANSTQTSPTANKETLLLEFIYYGRSTKSTLSSTCVPMITTCSSSTRDSMEISTRSELSIVPTHKSNESRGSSLKPSVGKTTSNSSGQSSRSGLSKGSTDTSEESRTSSTKPPSLGMTSSQSSRSSSIKPPSVGMTSSQSNRQKLIRLRMRSSRATSLDSANSMLSVEFTDNEQLGCEESIIEEQGAFPPEPIASAFTAASTEHSSSVHAPAGVQHLNKFTCSEKVRYLGEFELPNEDGPTYDDDDDRRQKLRKSSLQRMPFYDIEPKETIEDYGQEYYLGDLGDQGVGDHEKGDVDYSTSSKLKKRKDIVSSEREKRLLALQQELLFKKDLLNKPVPMTQFSSLDVSKYVADSEMHVLERQNTTVVPTFDDFCHLMIECNREDVKKRSKMKQSVYELRKSFLNIGPSRIPSGVPSGEPSGEPSMSDVVGTITASPACKRFWHEQKLKEKTLENWGKTTSARGRSCSIAEEDSFTVSAMNDFNFKTMPKMVLRPPSQPSSPRKQSKAIPAPVTRQVDTQQQRDKAPLVYVTSSVGITYIHETSYKLRKQRDIQRQLDKINKNPTPIRKPLKPATDRSKPKRQPKMANSSPSKKRKSTKSKKPDQEVEQEDEKYDFDSSKLNTNYSIEQIERIILAKKVRMRNTGKLELFRVLQKYCRYQNVIKAFQSKCSDLPATVSSLTNPSQFGDLFDLPATLSSWTNPSQLGDLFENISSSTSTEEPITVGKLKWFSFMAEAQPECGDTMLAAPEFGTYSTQVFRDNMERALDEFVVRKEMVMSDVNAKASTSITITRKSVFRAAKYKNTHL